MKSDLPKLSFPAVKLRIVLREGRTLVWDSLRGMYLVLTPEEWVRRHLIEYLISSCGAHPLRIVQEYAVALNGSPQRADVVVVDENGHPLLLAECKAGDVVIDEKTFAQAVRYNSVLDARYIILTNGMRHYCFEFREGRYIPLSGFPSLGL